MPQQNFYTGNLAGLNESEIPALRTQFGKNVLNKESSDFARTLREVMSEPMFIILVLACSIYFILGQVNEGLMMAVAVLLVTTISIYQGARSSKALKALEELTAPNVVVIRGGKEKILPVAELVPGDLMILEEGERVPADGLIVKQNDFTVNEAVISGESLPVEKNEKTGYNIYHGSLVNSGKCYATVTAIGRFTTLGKIGKSVEQYSPLKTPLQLSINLFVKRLALFGVIAFVLIWLLNYLKTDNFLGSLLIGLTLAMAAIPEEIPVAFSSFMALGAYRMSRLGIISRQPQIIENLGAVSVICLDKTGTITENIMDVKSIYDFHSDQLFDLETTGAADHSKLLWHAALASEAEPFDEMEKGIWRAYQQYYHGEIEKVKMVSEYPLAGNPPMMTHVYKANSDGKLIISAKGAPEKIATVCKLSEEVKRRLMSIVKSMAQKGQRVIGVANAFHEGILPVNQEQFNWNFDGLISLYDPPKRNVREVLRQFSSSGIEVKLVTGDFPETAMNIAEQVGIQNFQRCIDGEHLMQMNEADLRKNAMEYVVFARMFPDAKRKLMDAIKANGKTVAMTGDGVNDALALKAADVGIAMGRRGTQIARQAADLILTDDNLHGVVEAIRHGRRIFSNLKKAVRYIISIHIPIILTASLPVLFGWKFPNIFTPVHVIFLELIMGPTCSIFFENEPEESNLMSTSFRSKNGGLFEKGELLISLTQGVMITAGVLVLYYIFMNNGNTLEQTRTIVFTTLVISNIFLTFTNRSFTENFISTIRYRNQLALPVLLISIMFLLIIHLLPIARSLFGLSVINLNEFLICVGTAFISVMWFEMYKSNLTNLSSGIDKRYISGT